MKETGRPRPRSADPIHRPAASVRPCGGTQMRLTRMSVLFGGVAMAAVVTAACEGSKMPATSPAASTGAADAMAGMDHSAMPIGAEGEIYIADLLPLNAGTGYRNVKGQARFQIVN